MLHLRKHLAPLLRAASHGTAVPLPSSIQCRALFFSTSAPHSTPTPFSTEEYLVATCGLTRAQALKASKKLTTLKSASKPDAVLALLSGAGLSRPNIAAVVAADPLLLRAKVGTIAPRLTSLRDRVGLSPPQIARFLLFGGTTVLRSGGDVATKLEFWIPLLGSFGKLVQITRRNNSLLNVSLEKIAKPNISLLKQCGLSDCDIVKLLTSFSRLFASKPGRLKTLVQRVKKFGVPRTSSAFKYALGVASYVNEDKVALRMEFLKNITGCSMDKVRLAVRRMPQILGLTEENLRRKIEFLVTEARLEVAYILERPVLLSYSLQKRMVPRYHVVKILQENGLEEDISFKSIFSCCEDEFIERYIDCHKDTIPSLADGYVAALAGNSKGSVAAEATSSSCDVASGGWNLLCNGGEGVAG